MAEEEEYEFTPPDFDEDAFIHKEMVSFRTTGILFLWGIIMGLITWSIFIGMDGTKSSWYASLLVAAVGGYALKFIFPRVKADVSHFKRREWLGTGFLYFFTWLAMAIFLVNPPISDFTDPAADIFVSPAHQMEGGDVVLDMFFMDNAKIADFSFQLERGGNPLADIDDAVRINAGHYQYVASDLPPGSYKVVASATDGKGRTTTNEIPFQVRGPSNPLAAEAIIPNSLAAGEFALVKVPGDVTPYAVYAKTATSKVYFENDPAIGYWKASAIFAGWLEGNNQFDVIIEEANRFEAGELIAGGQIDLGSYNMTVQGASGTYTKSIPKAQPTTAPMRQVPGLEVGVLAVALVGLAVVARRKQD